MQTGGPSKPLRMPQHARAAQVQRVLGGVTSQHARQLLLARTSARYLGRLVAGLQQRGAQEAKFRRCGRPKP